MKLKTLRYVAILSLVLLICQCRKRDLNDYKGPQGSAGNDAGIFNQVISVPSAKWQADTVAQQWKATIFSDQISAGIISDGVVQVFAEKDNRWQIMPLVIEDEFYQFGFETGILHLSFGDSHGPIPTEKPEDLKIKLVILHSTN